MGSNGTTQTDGVLVNDWSKFSQQMLALYAVNKLGNPNSVVPKDDTAVIANTATPQTQMAGLGAMVRSPVGIAVIAGSALLLFFMLRKR